MWCSTREAGRPPISRVRSSTGALFSSSSSSKTWSGFSQQRLHTQDLPGLSVTENNHFYWNTGLCLLSKYFPSVSSHSNYLLKACCYSFCSLRIHKSFCCFSGEKYVEILAWQPLLTHMNITRAEDEGGELGGRRAPLSFPLSRCQSKIFCGTLFFSLMGRIHEKILNEVGIWNTHLSVHILSF